MQRTLAMLAALSVGISVTACSKQKAPVKPSTTQQPSELAWKISLLSHCDENTGSEECVGHYGFSVAADGTYHVGPGPQGQELSGKVSDDELAPIASFIATANTDTSGASSSSLAETCKEPAAPTDAADSTATATTSTSEDSITVSKHGHQHSLVRTTATQFCYQSLKVETAESLHHALAALAKKYYTLPFPDACADAIAEVHLLYPSVQKCTVATDCAYFNESLEPVTMGTSEWVITDACSKMNALYVGNVATVTERKANLIAAMENARAVCGPRIVRDWECTSRTAFDAGLAPAPVCFRGSCQLNPGVSN